MIAWLVAFAFTQAVEAPLYLRATGGRWLVALGASAVTHPVVWFVFPALLPHSYGWMLAAAESFAVLVEAGWLLAFRVPRALLLSLLANGASLAAGFVLRAVFGAP